VDVHSLIEHAATPSESFEVRPAAGGGLCIKRCTCTDTFIAIPDTIGNEAVTEIAPGAFAGLPAITIICARSIATVGRGAFRDCKQLVELVLPESVDHMDSTWVEGCPSLTRVAMPGKMRAVKLGYSRMTSVREVYIGAQTREVNLAHVDDALLDRVIVDKDNPWLLSDGVCLYDSSGETLLRCMTRAEHCTVLPSCKTIASEAFAYNTCLHSIDFSEGLEIIDERAFAGCSLEKLSFPHSLKHIGERAFSNCHRLEKLELNEGLERIDSLAFAGCESLIDVHIPASVTFFALDAFANSRAVSHEHIDIDPNSSSYLLDEPCVLYRKEGGSLKLVGTLSNLTGTYQVLPGTRSIGPKAFSYCPALRSVELPEGIESIGPSAFMRCGALKHVNFPDTLVSLGERAFYGTSLTAVSIPASLRELGPLALAFTAETSEYIDSPFGGMHIGFSGAAPLKISRHADDACAIEVDTNNDNFQIVSDLLCQREQDGNLTALKYTGSGTRIVIPKEVTRIGQNALASAYHVTELILHDGITRVEPRGLTITHPLVRIGMESSTAPESFEVYPLQNPYGIWAQNHAYLSGTLDLAVLAQDCDETMVRNLPGFERMWRFVGRLAHPLFLSSRLKRILQEDVSENLHDYVREFSRRNYLTGIRQLIDTGLIGPVEVSVALDAAHEVQGVAAAGLIMDECRRRFHMRGLDLDL
jgi:hypothetical protein